MTETSGADAYKAPEVNLGVLGARKVLDTPFSVNVLTRDLMDNQQAQFYGDYLKNDPSVTSGNVPVGFSTLRGFSVGTDGYLLDGMPGAQPLSDGRFQLIGVERIEVMKGPSAFLNGLGNSSSLGGTFNFVLKKPEEDSVRSVSTGISTRSLTSISADLGDRFGVDKQFGYRLNVGAKDGTQPFKDAGWKQQAATLALDWRASSSINLSGGFEYARNKLPQLQPFFALAPGLAVPAAPNARNNIAQPWDDFRVEGVNLWARADVKVSPDWTLSAQALHSTDRRDNTPEARFGTISSAAGAVTLFGQQDGGSKSIGDTLQLSARGKLVTGGMAHGITAALSATDTENRAGNRASYGAFATDLYNPVSYATPAFVVGSPLKTTQKTATHSLLLSDFVALNDQWAVLLGLRHARLTVDNYDTTTGAVSNSDALSKTTPSAALIYKPTPASSVYVSYAGGVEMGGRAPAGSANANQLLSPIVTKQTEVGAKLESGGVLWTAAVFDMRKPFEYLDATTLQYVQKGVQRHKGLEFTASGKLTPSLSLLAGLMALDPKTTRTGVASTEGKKPMGVASLVYNLFAEYRIAAVPGLYVNGGIYHSGPQYLDGANTQKVSGWTRYDAGVRLETKIQSQPVSLLFNVENLANKSYWAGAQSGILTLAEPRTFKATARFYF